MIIQVKIYGSLSRSVSVPDSLLQGDKCHIPEGATVGQFLEILNVPRELSLVLLVNGKHATKEKVLKDGDLLHVLPPMTGG
jgi:molybdopterin converting factor small subunit